MSTQASTDAPLFIEHTNKTLGCTPTDVKWIPSSPRFVTTGTHPKGTGSVQVWEMVPGEGARAIGEVVRPEGIKCGTFGASFLEDRHFAVADCKGSLAILDLSRSSSSSSSGSSSASASSSTALTVGGGGGSDSSSSGDANGGISGSVVWRVPAAHSSFINCIDGCGGLGIGGGAPELVTGGRDGCVKLWDPRVQDPVLSMEPVTGQGARECWCVAFGGASSDEERCIAAGYDNGDVKLFDLRTQSIRWETNIGNGVVSCEFDRKDIEMNKLLCTMLESKYRLFDMRTQHPVEGYAHRTEKAHKSTVWMVKHLPQNRDVWLTSGGNGGLNLYRYTYPAQRTERDPEGHPRGKMGGVELLNARIVSTQPVVGWDWSSDKCGLAAAVCLDQTLRVFIVSRLDKL